jgi:glycerol-3-phosphate dehydrogenase
MVSNLFVSEEIRFFSDDDIAGMKIFAALKRVVKRITTIWLF